MTYGLCTDRSGVIHYQHTNSLQQEIDMSIQQSAQSARSSSTAGGASRRDCTRSHPSAAGETSPAGSAAHHGYPERQPGIGYGHSSGYVSRDAYKAAGRYSQSAGSSLFRFH